MKREGFGMGSLSMKMSRRKKKTRTKSVGNVESGARNTTDDVRFFLLTALRLLTNSPGREEELLDLDEDDLELMEENTGTSFKKSRLTRLRRGGPDGDSPPSGSSKRRAVVESSDDDLDQGLPQVQDIQRIWDDGGRDDDDDGDIDAMDDFIDYDEEDEAGAPMDEEAREERRKERRKLEKERRRAQGIRPELAGIDAK